MGLGIGFGSSYSVFDRSSSSVFDKCGTQPIQQPQPRAVNPDPKNYKIIRTHTIGESFPLVVVEIMYPDCTNFEGRKIMVFKGTDLVQLMDMKVIDPHFTDDTSKSPIARFRPTEEGWADAVEFAKQKSIEF